jgi:hypothetical protein
VLHIVSSTGRTATSFIAECLDRLPGIAASHEGHRRNDDGADLLPLVNLENFQVFRDPAAGERVVDAKRSSVQIEAAHASTGCRDVVDVAYYNAILGSALLSAHPAIRMVAIFRDCEAFVRSSTWLHGVDPMPVGWPDPAKSLDSRERFVAMGRIRPVDPPDVESWPTWGAVERNIWLWRATNARLCDALDHWPDRVVPLRFDLLRERGAVEFVTRVLVGLRLDSPEVLEQLAVAVGAASQRTNERSGGYQIDSADTWTSQQSQMLREAQHDIEERLGQWEM